jgi:hypothetical protein
MITGPNGKPYKLVIQTAFDRNGDRVISSRDIRGKAGDWTEVAVRQGVTSYGHKASGWDKAEIIAGGLAGAPYPEGSSYDKSKLKDIHVMTDGGAYVSDPEIIPGGSVKEASAEAQRGKGNELWVAPRSGLAGGRTSTAPDAVGLIDGVLTGVALAMHLNDPMAARYRVVFEEDSLGNRQARMLLYRVTDSPGGPEAIDIEAGYVDSNHELASVPITGEDADAPAYAH